MCVRLLLVGHFLLTLYTVLIGASERSWIYLYQTTSRSHIIKHVDTGWHCRVHHFPFHVGGGHLSSLQGVTIGDYNFPFWVLRGPLLPPPLTAARMHLVVFSQVVSKIVSVGSNKLVCVLVINSVYWRCGGLFGFTGVEAVGCDGSSKNFILGYET